MDRPAGGRIKEEEVRRRLETQTRGGESRAPRYSSLAQPEYRRLMLYWLFLGYPLSAH